MSDKKNVAYRFSATLTSSVEVTKVILPDMLPPEFRWNYPVLSGMTSLANRHAKLIWVLPWLSSW